MKQGSASANARFSSSMSRGGEEMASLPVPDELLAEIFLRLPTPADLVRASSTCVSFRRVAAHRSFVRRFRKLHAPPLLGFLDDARYFHPAVAPYPSSSAARAVSRAADFRFSFLPTRARTWIVKDIRDGRVLLDSAKTDQAVFKELVVCDPLHRRYLMLPPIPDDLAVSVEEPQLWCEAFLVPPDDDESEEETSFRVIWMAQCKTTLSAFVFSSSTGRWRAIPSQRWNDLIAGSQSSAHVLFAFRQYSYDCFYWRQDCDGSTNMLVLDTRRMEFSIAEPPPEAKFGYGLSVAMVETGENRPGMFVLTYGASALKYSIRQKDDGSSSQWQKEETISLGSGHCLITSTERYLLLYKFPSSFHSSGFYTLDVKTFQLEKMCDTLPYSFFELHTYSNFPPSLLSLPTIPCGVENEAEEMLKQSCAASSSAS